MYAYHALAVSFQTKWHAVTNVGCRAGGLAELARAAHGNHFHGPQPAELVPHTAFTRETNRTSRISARLACFRPVIFADLTVSDY